MKNFVHYKSNLSPYHHGSLKVITNISSSNKCAGICRDIGAETFSEAQQV